MSQDLVSATRWRLMEFLKSKTAAIPTLLFLLTVATRIPFSSKLLYHMDSVHFALALERYDVTVHQPHPPGYFLYVMLGRLVHLFINDANGVFVFLSIVFSGLTVAVIFLLAEEMYDRKTGVVAACFALTSPNLWFHGEVALSYGAEGFFSVLVGFFCWRVYTGKVNDLWLSAIALGIAGGIRQNTVAFLLPLLLLSARKLAPGKVAAALLLLGAVCCAWFFPMVQMTGGWNAYSRALKELWQFNTGHNSVFEHGWRMFSLFSRTLYNFTAYSIGAGMFAAGFGAYTFLRYGSAPADLKKVSFFSAWILPSVAFYLLIFIHPSNPGYALVFAPPLLVLCARAAVYWGAEVRVLWGKDLTVLLTSASLLVNTGAFLFSNWPVSHRTIKEHDRDLASIVTGLQSFDPSKTAFFVIPYLFIGFRQVMYYLPQYRVYQVNMITFPSGEKRKIFWGIGRNTFLTKEVELPKSIRYFATVLDLEENELISNHKEITARPVEPRITIASGPIDLVQQIFPIGIVSNPEDHF
jgi:hypothetical protein